jgi:hypothetical protein
MIPGSPEAFRQYGRRTSPATSDSFGSGHGHRTREDLLGDNGGTFAFDGLEAAARRAKDAAGDKAVPVLGADVARHLLRAGLLDRCASTSSLC